MTSTNSSIDQCTPVIPHRTVFAIAVFAIFVCATFATAQAPSSSLYKPWMIGPFTQVDSANPVLGPNFDSLFFCPIRKENIRWEARAILGAAAIV